MARLLTLTLSCMLVVGSIAPADAQVTTGSIVGTVKDTSGAVLPGVNVTAINIDTNLSRSEVSNERGEYSLQFLPPGSYRLEAELTGFKRFVQTGVEIELARAARVRSGPGGGRDDRERQSPRGRAARRYGARGPRRTVNTTEILNLPLVDRDVYTLLDLTAGIDSSETSDAFGIPARKRSSTGSANTGAGSVNYSLDGGAKLRVRQTGNIVPNPDAVREFRVQTNSYAAEHGRFGGAVVDVVSKSGTNAFPAHLRDLPRRQHERRALDEARTNTGESCRTQQLAAAQRTNLRNRTFFFASYNGRAAAAANEASADVPSPLERQSDYRRRSTTATSWYHRSADREAVPRQQDSVEPVRSGRRADPQRLDSLRTCPATATKSSTIPLNGTSSASSSITD